MLLLLFACGIPPSGTTPPVGDDSVGGFVCDPKNEDCRPGTCGGEGGRMLPGADCVVCHDGTSSEDDEAPRFGAAGTAFRDLGGSDGLSDALVRVTDANGTVVELATNSVGNFYTTRTFVFPIDAEIEVGGTVRAMAASVDVGACNSCHACDGEAGGKLTGP
jgi:hypothetical protein